MGFPSIIYIFNYGLLYRVSKDLLGYSREQVHWLMSLHEGEWLGDTNPYIRNIKFSSFMDAHNGIPNVFSKTISFTKKVTKGETKG